MKEECEELGIAMLYSTRFAREKLSRERRTDAAVLTANYRRIAAAVLWQSNKAASLFNIKHIYH